MASARTNLMDTRKTLKPVAIERPARNREMISQTKDFSEAESKEGPIKKGRSDVFHEGYVGGQKYLVPDRNLEAMADMINLKMRRQEYSRYMNDEEMLMEHETNPEEHYQKRGEKMLKKIDNLADSDEDSVISYEGDEWSDKKNDYEAEDEADKLQELPTSSDEESESEEENVKRLYEDEVEEFEEEAVEEENEKVEGDEEDRDDLDDADKEEAIEENVEEEEVDEEGDEDLASSEEPVVLPLKEQYPEEDEKIVQVDREDKDEESNDVEEEEVGSNEEEEKKVVEPIVTTMPDYTLNTGKYHDPEVKRFLISGHFRSNRKPIYIVQEYEGPTLFKSKNPEFFSRRSEKDVDVLMRGEFFKESILEEDRYMQPVSLNTTPRKVPIDWKSMIFEEKFTHVFVGTDVDVQISGSFIEHSIKELYTPLISLVFRKGTAHSTPADDSEELSCSPSDVFLMRPIQEQPFEREDTWQTGRDRKGKNVKPKTLVTTPCDARFGPYSGQEDDWRSSQVPSESSRGPYPGQDDDTRSSEASSESSRLYKLRDSMRETLLLPETSLRRARGRPGYLEGSESASVRRRHIRSSLTSEETPAEILEAFVKTAGEKRRERRRKERQRTLGSVLSRFFSSK